MFQGYTALVAKPHLHRRVAGTGCYATVVVAVPTHLNISIHTPGLAPAGEGKGEGGRGRGGGRE